MQSTNLAISMTSRCLLILLAWLCHSALTLAPAYGQQPKTVIVGYTSLQPPYVIDTRGKGLTFDLLKAMSNASAEFTFQAKRFYPARTNYIAYKRKFDLIAFNNLAWGWNRNGASQSLPLIHDQDVFFRKIQTSQKRGTFKIAATRGFTYAFADFSISRLAAMPNVLLVEDEVDTIPLVLRGRADKGIASSALLRWSFHSNAELKRQLTLTGKVDHSYDRAFIVFSHAAISPDALNALLRTLKSSGDLRAVFAKYGLEEPPLSLGVSP